MPMLYSLDEICLTPAAVSPIKHRSDVIIYDTHNKLPLFAAPMSCIVNGENNVHFENEGINTIVPRTVLWKDRQRTIIAGQWTAVGLKEAQYLLEDWDVLICPKIRLCIDQADGHMEDLITLCFELKERFGDRIRIMTGNVANPYVYKEYARAGIDYIRVGIGGGSACFIAGTKVKTIDGYKNIEDITSNDIVITTHGERPVKNTFIKTTNTLVTINDDITCTPDHKFLVINKADKDFVTEENLDKYSFYIEANKLSDDYLLVKA